MIKSFHEAFDQDRRDGTLDDATSQQLAEEAKRAEANGYTEFATLLRSNIKITADHKLLEQQRKDMDAFYASGTLTEKHVRDSGLQGQEYTDYLEKARENLAVVAPTKENLDEAKNIIKSELNARVTGGAAFDGPLPSGYYTGVRRETDRYTRAYRNSMRKTGDHETAHQVAMGAVNAVIGTDSTKGLYAVGSTLEEIRKQLSKGGRPGDFTSEQLKYKPVDVSNTSSVTEIRQRIDDLGRKAIPTLVSKKRLAITLDGYKETGRISRDPSLEVAAKELNMPYAEVHNLAATELGDDSLKLPKKLYDDAIEVETAARSTRWNKFLNSRANLEQSVITGGVVTELGGAPYAMSAAAQGFTGDFEGLYNSMRMQESSGDPTQKNEDSGAMGELQVMPDNIGPWSKEILGREVTKEEFMADPEIQRKVGRGKLRQYYNEYLLRGESPDEAIRKTAASWYAGPNWESSYGPNFHNDTKPQMYGRTKYPSMLEYTTKVLQRVRGN